MTAIDLNEELAIQEGQWRGRLVTLGVLLALAAAVAVGVYWFFLRGSEGAARATEDITVNRATISANLIVSGTADTQLNSDLNFQASGRVDSVAVRVGDAVKQGQVLAALESDDLANNVATAQANLVSAQLKLQDLLDGATAAERAAAEQTLAQAQATFDKAQNDITDMLDGPSPAERAAAEQAVSAAQAQLTQAETARTKLDEGASDAEIVAAEAAVEQAESALTSAQNTASNAANTVTSARGALFSAETAYCPDAAVAFCTTRVAPISAADEALMFSVAGGSDSALAAKASTVLTANTTYKNAVTAQASAEASVASAEAALDSAEEKLAALEDGASDGDIASADAAVASAQQALTAAQAKLDDLLDGPTPLQLSTAQSAFAGAGAALDAAQARRDEVVRGPEQNQIDQATQAVRTAELAVEAAQIRIKNAQIIAPFDGTVAAVNATPGEFASAAAQTPAIVLLTPDLLVFKMSVGETDYPNIKPDQAGGVIFDSIPGKIYPFRIVEIGLSPTVTQGVVTYQVEAALVVLPGNPRPAPGMNARGQIITERKTDILAIPPRAIRRRGTDQVVDVRRGGGRVEEVVVTTGLSDAENVEVLTGLSEGDVVVVPAVAGGRAGGGPTPVPTLPGGIR